MIIRLCDYEKRKGQDDTDTPRGKKPRDKKDWHWRDKAANQRILRIARKPVDARNFKKGFISEAFRRITVLNLTLLYRDKIFKNFTGVTDVKMWTYAGGDVLNCVHWGRDPTGMCVLVSIDAEQVHPIWVLGKSNWYLQQEQYMLLTDEPSL